MCMSGPSLLIESTDSMIVPLLLVNLLETVIPFGASSVLWKRSYVELQLHMPIIDVLRYAMG